MDIQLVNDAQSVAYYICSYICKSEPDELRNALGNLIHNLREQQPQLTAYQRLWKIGTTVLRHRRMSGQEASYRSSQLHMIQTSRKVVYLNIRTPDKQYKMLKSKAKLDNLDDESTDIFRQNILDYYRARPTHLLDKSLYYFASWFQHGSPPRNVNDNDDHHIYIAEYNLWFHRRNQPVIIRYPQSGVHTEDYYYSLSILLLPHQQEEDILSPYNSAQSAFTNKQNLLDRPIDHTFFSFATDIDNAVRRIRLIEEEQFQHLNCNSNENNVPDFSDNCMDTESVPSDIVDQEGNIHSEPADDEYICHNLPICRMSHIQLSNAFSTLTQCQKHAFSIIHAHFRSNSASL